MLEQTIRPYYQRCLVDPLVKNLTKGTEISANSVSVAACLIGLLLIPALWAHFPVIALMCLWVSGYLDTVDGSLARARNQDSEKGSVLDIIFDRVVESAIFIGLYLYAPNERGLWVILMFAATYLCITSFLLVAVFRRGRRTDKSFYYSPGIIERAEAFIIFSAMIVWPNHFILFAVGYSILVLLTAVFRIKEFLKYDD